MAKHFNNEVLTRKKQKIWFFFGRSISLNGSPQVLSIHAYLTRNSWEHNADTLEITVSKLIRPERV